MKVSPGEQLTRFIRFSKHFSEPDTVRHAAFLPHKTQVDISVFRISELFGSEELSDADIWEMGRKYVQTKERAVKARADLLAASVYKNNLEVIPGDDPPRHANITPLPVDNPTNRKARRALATKLANASKLVVPPEDT